MCAAFMKRVTSAHPPRGVSPLLLSMTKFIKLIWQQEPITGHAAAAARANKTNRSIVTSMTSRPSDLVRRRDSGVHISTFTSYTGPYSMYRPEAPPVFSSPSPSPSSPPPLSSPPSLYLYPPFTSRPGEGWPWCSGASWIRKQI